MAIRRFFKSIPWFVSPIRLHCRQCPGVNQGDPVSGLCKKCSQIARKRVRDGDAEHLFKTENESPSIQLFYDLWFVAVLSACSTTHEITNLQQMRTYLGFFTLIWFTWFGTILFDVRFAFDSWFIRLSKAWSLGIMALFAMTLVPFDPEKNVFGHDLQTLGIVLMVSRFFLVVQYAVIMWNVHHAFGDRRLMWPFIATMATSFIAAFIFGGTYWEDTKHSTVTVVIWLTTSAVEGAILLFISCRSEVMSFCGKSLVERMGALTLIVMGEGIIGMTESISDILKTSPTVSGATVGVTITVMLTCYSIWILYFDHTDNEDPAERITKSSPRRQIWAFLHFPLHVAILLTLKGCAALMLWWVAVEALSFQPLATLFSLDTSNSTTWISDVETALNQTLEKYSGIKLTPAVQGDVDSLRNLTSLSDSSASDDASDLTFKIWEDIFNAICSTLNLASSDDTGTTSSSAAAEDDLDQRIFSIFEEFEGTWFVTFFIAAGCTLIALALLRYVGLEEGSNGTWSKKRVSKSQVAVGVHVLMGFALATIAFMALDTNSDRLSNYIFSPWLIPTVFLTYLLAITCDIILYYAKYSNVSHPPMMEGEQEDKEVDEYEDYRGYAPVHFKQPKPHEPPREKQLPVHERHSSASALLTPHLSPNTYEIDELSLARTEESRIYQGEGYPQTEEEFGP